MRIASACILAAFTLGASLTEARAQCLQANFNEIVEGHLAQRQFWDAAGRPEPAFLLILSAPVCLSGEYELDNVDTARSIQIYSGDDEVERRIGRLVGERVVVQGKPFGAATVHHHAPIVMDVARIDARARRASEMPDLVQPRRGSALRATLLNAARPVFEEESGGAIEFVVGRLNVYGDWAFGEVRLQRPGGVPIDWRRTRYAEGYRAGMFDPAGSFFLLHRSGGSWNLMEHATGPTDVTWDGWRRDYGLPLAMFQR